MRLRMEGFCGRLLFFSHLTYLLLTCKWLSSRLSRFYKVEVRVSQLKCQLLTRRSDMSTTVLPSARPTHFAGIQFATDIITRVEWIFCTLSMLLLTIPAPSELYSTSISEAVCERRLQSLAQYSFFVMNGESGGTESSSCVAEISQ